MALPGKFHYVKVHKHKHQYAYAYAWKNTSNSLINTYPSDLKFICLYTKIHKEEKFYWVLKDSNKDFFNVVLH